MAQLIYSILALLMIMFLSMNTQRNIGRDQQEQTVNEIGTQLTGVGTEVLELIGSRYFDAYTYANRNTQPYCGRVADDQLTLFSSETRPAADPGNTHGDCTDYTACNYIEGFQGIDTTLTRGEFDYRVEILDVEYVDPLNFFSSSAASTFAKKVSVRVTNPFLYIGDDPTNTFSLDVERVFTYGCLTDPNLIPYVLAADTCPANPCTRWY